jgi:hypothetical protein
MIWIEFIVCAAAIIWAGSMLSKYGDVLADKTGLGRAWVGALLIAGVTSLPELATGLSAVAWLNQSKLAAGAMMDLAYQPGRILAKAHDGHILSGGLGIELDVVNAGSESVPAHGIQSRPSPPSAYPRFKPCGGCIGLWQSSTGKNSLLEVKAKPTLLIRAST